MQNAVNAVYFSVLRKVSLSKRGRFQLSKTYTAFTAGDHVRARVCTHILARTCKRTFIETPKYTAFTAG